MWCWTFLLLAPAASLAAVPASDEPTGSFSLRASRRLDSRDYHDWAAAHRKWGSGPPKGEKINAFSLVQGGSKVDVQPTSGDQVYVADIEIGTPPQTLKLALDTGSSDVWVQSVSTKYRINSDGPWPPRYNPNTSTTARQVENAMWNIQYADKSNAVGVVFYDILRLGDFEIKDALIESAATVSDAFETETGFSGILGLAKRLDNNIQPRKPTFLSTLKAQLHEPIFAIDLRRNTSSRFDFGRVNESQASENLTWLDSNRQSPHWTVTFDLTAWSGNHSVWVYHKFDAVIDTGTSLMFLPQGLTDMYWRQVSGLQTSPETGGSYHFPCQVGDTLPDLMFKLPGTEHVLTIPGRYLNYGPIKADPSMCWGGMQSSSQLDGTAILGDVMLKALYVAFDLDKERVGFANKALHDLR